MPSMKTNIHSDFTTWIFPLFEQGVRQVTWKSIKNRQIKFEARWIAFFVICILLGSIGDCLNKCGHPIFCIKNLDGVSLVILQIQGTIDTLSIAVLSLLGGRISESYLGIPLIDFALNRKPRWLKQMRIVCLLIILLSVNILVHLAELYNLVLALFLVSEGLICFSVMEIYEVFSGHIELGNEIKCYIEDKIGSGTHSDKINLLSKFCDEWKTKILSQSEPEFKIYQDVFDVIFKNIFLDETPNSRTELQRCVYDVIFALLHSENLALKKKGLCLVKRIYSNAWSCVSADKNKALGLTDGFHLFHTISDDLRNAVEQLPVSEVERELQWVTTSEYVLLVNYWVAGGSEDQGDLSALNSFAAAMGYYVARNKDQEWHSIIWEKPLAYLRAPLVCPEGRQEDMKRQQSTMLFRYAVSLVNSNMLDILGNSLYAQAIPRLYPPVDKYDALLVLKIHCYIYYLAEYESTECISDNLKNACKAFLRSDKIRHIFSDFLYRISSSKEVFNQALEKVLLKELKWLEFFPARAMSKTSIMGTVVRNYVLFITLYLFGEHDPHHLMDQVLSDEMVRYNLPLYLQDSDAVIRQLETFLMLLGIPENRPYREKAQEKYMVLEREAKRRLKKIELSQAAQQAQNEDPVSTEGSESQIRQYILEKFSPLISEDAKDGSKSTVDCFRMDTLSDMSVENLLLECLNEIAGGLSYGIYNDLRKSGFLQVVKRSDFPDDAEYIAYLKNNNADIVLGSQWLFHTRRYEDQKNIDRYLEGRKTIFTGFTNWGILLKDSSLQIYVEDVQVLIRPCSIGDSGARFDSEQSVYVYNVSGIDLKFTEDELTDYLKQKRRIVDVKIRLRTKKAEGSHGVLLWNDSMDAPGTLGP